MVRTVGGQSQLGQQVVRDCLPDIGTVHFESAKHQARPQHNLEVNLPDEGALLPPRPSGRGVEPVDVFPVGLWLVLAC